MKHFAITSSLVAMLFASMLAHAEDGLLTGDVKLACEAVLCLSSGGRPDECSPALNRYFGIVRKKARETREARKEFLQQCPDTSQDAQMASLVDTISISAGNCDAAALNSSFWRLNSTLPAYCATYADHAYTDITPPVYVGLPERGGLWVEQVDYERALREYTARVAAEDEEARRLAQVNGGN